MMRMADIGVSQCITGLTVTLCPSFDLFHPAIPRYKVTALTSVLIHTNKITETPEKQYQVLGIHSYIRLANNHILFTTYSTR